MRTINIPFNPMLCLPRSTLVSQSCFQSSFIRCKTAIMQEVIFSKSIIYLYTTIPLIIASGLSNVAATRFTILELCSLSILPNKKCQGKMRKTQPCGRKMNSLKHYLSVFWVKCDLRFAEKKKHFFILRHSGHVTP